MPITAAELSKKLEKLNTENLEAVNDLVERLIAKPDNPSSAQKIRLTKEPQLFSKLKTIPIEMEGIDFDRSKIYDNKS